MYTRYTLYTVWHFVFFGASSFRPFVIINVVSAKYSLWTVWTVNHSVNHFQLMVLLATDLSKKVKKIFLKWMFNQVFSTSALHKNWSCHSWSRCNGICLAYGPDTCVTVGADATVYVWLMGQIHVSQLEQMQRYICMSVAYGPDTTCVHVQTHDMYSIRSSRDRIGFYVEIQINY